MSLTRERRRALLALATVLATTVALVVPFIGYAMAQGTPNVVIINPSDYSDDGASQTPLIVSDVPTGDDEDEGLNETTYRFNAWASNVPAEALLEFELVAGLDTITLGTATRLDDTFELNWDVNVPDGRYTIRAILYEGSGVFAEEIDRHERPILILRGSPVADAASPTVDLLYPENGQPAGFYVNPTTGNTNILIDYEFSDDTDAIFFFYTLSDPGDDPVWKECAGAGGGSAGSGRVRCDLESQDQGGGSVTGIAAVANDDDSGGEDPTFNGSGDAVRILPYLQDPTAMTIDRETTRVDSNNQGVFACSAAQSVTVLDQSSHAIGDINVDVHASGPSDQTRFWTGSPPFFAAPPTMRNAPDQAHGTELGWACPLPDRNAEFARPQGDHNRVGVPDVKHVENATTGNTGTAGAALHADRQGETFLTFWADEDNDDQYCSAELAIPASIGWDVPAPAPVLEPAQLDFCPVPSPPPPGQTGSPTGTTSPSPSPTESPSPDPRGCTIRGTEDDDTLTGTADDDVICGLGGDDTIRGLAGNDVIHGDAGDDTIRAGAGNDTVDGGAGVDGIAGDSGDDVLDGGGELDIVIGGNGDDTIRGNAGDDELSGGQGRDIIQGGSGNDSGRGGPGDDVMRGGAGKDQFSGNGGPDTIRGGPQNDRLAGGRGPDTIRGGPGRDRCRGGPGRDRLGSCER